MKTIIDAHCHIYPEAIARKAVRAVERFYGGLPAVPRDGTAGTLLATGRDAGIARFVVHSVATRPEQVDAINDFIARSVAESGGAFIGMGTMHPDSQSPERDFRVLRMLGLRGVKLHPDIQGFNADDPRAMRIYELCEAAGLPVCLHTGDYRYDYSNPPRIVNVLKAFPRLKLIGAHFGGWSVWDAAARALPDYPNMWVDTSSTTYALEPEKIRALIGVWGSGRVMFGTDYPMWPQRPEIDRLLALDLPEGDRENIFRRTCEKLFGLTETEG